MSDPEADDQDERRVRLLARGMFQVTGGSRTSLAYAVATGTVTWVFVDGRVYVIDAAARDGSARAPQHLDDLALAAPMPATVLVLNVAPGQQVARGDVMIVLEAMKMELQITAPRDARVKSVACQQGDMVQPGVALVELE